MTAQELTTGRRCPECGQIVIPLPICTCGDGIAMHDINGKGERTACSVVSRAGPCGCQRFTETAGMPGG